MGPVARGAVALGSRCPCGGSRGVGEGAAAPACPARGHRPPLPARRGRRGQRRVGDELSRCAGRGGGGGARRGLAERCARGRRWGGAGPLCPARCPAENEGLEGTKGCVCCWGAALGVPAAARRLKAAATGAPKRRRFDALGPPAAPFAGGSGKAAGLWGNLRAVSLKRPNATRYVGRHFTQFYLL